MHPSVAAALAEALDLVLPVWCCACGSPGTDLCADCRADLVVAPGHRTLGEGWGVWSGLDYQGTTAAVLRSVKEEGRTSLARHLARALRAAVARAESEAYVVPVPTSRAAMRRRGYAVVETVLRRARVDFLPLLRVTRRTADQRTLGREERARNIAGSMRARPAAGLRVLIVDDVVTTGATLREARRALESAGAEVVGAATIASTARRFDTGQTRR